MGRKKEIYRDVRFFHRALQLQLRTSAIPENFCSGDSLRRGAISSVRTFTFTKVVRMMEQ